MDMYLFKDIFNYFLSMPSMKDDDIYTHVFFEVCFVVFPYPSIMLTYLCDWDSHFCLVKLGFTGVNIILPLPEKRKWSHRTASMNDYT